MLVPLTFPVSAASAVHADVHAGVNNFDRPAYTGARAIHTPVSKTPVSLNVLETSILSEFGTVGLSSTSFVSWDENDGYARPKSISNDVGSPSIPGISGSEGISNPNHRATTGELRGPRGVALGGKDGSVYIFHPSSIISPPFESASSAALSRSSRSSTQLPIINLGVPSSASRSASPATFNAGTHDQNLTRAHSHSRRYSRTLQLQTGTSHPHSHSRTSSHTHSHSHSRSRSHSASPTSSSLSLALMATTPGALMSHSVSPRARVVSGLSKEQAEASVPRTLASKHARPGKGNHEELDDEQERLKSILKGLESNGGGSGGVREHGLVDGLIPSFDKGIVLETSSEATFGAGNARDDNNSLASPRSLLSATNSPSFVPKVLPGPELPGTQSASTSIPALKSKSAPSSPYLFSPPLNPTSPPPGTTSPPSLHLAPSPAYDLNSPPHGLALKVHTFPPRCGLGHSVRDMCVISASDIFASHGISSAKKEVRGTQKTMIISLQASGNVSVFDSRDGTLLASASTVTNFTPSAPITGSSTLNSRNTTRSWTWTGMRVVRPGFIDANTSWNVGMGIRRNDDEKVALFLAYASPSPSPYPFDEGYYDEFDADLGVDNQPEHTLFAVYELRLSGAPSESGYVSDTATLSCIGIQVINGVRGDGCLEIYRDNSRAENSSSSPHLTLAYITHTNHLVTQSIAPLSSVSPPNQLQLHTAPSTTSFASSHHNSQHDPEHANKASVPTTTTLGIPGILRAFGAKSSEDLVSSGASSLGPSSAQSQPTSSPALAMNAVSVPTNSGLTSIQSGSTPLVVPGSGGAAIRANRAGCRVETAAVVGVGSHITRLHLEDPINRGVVCMSGLRVLGMRIQYSNESEDNAKMRGLAWTNEDIMIFEYTDANAYIDSETETEPDTGSHSPLRSVSTFSFNQMPTSSPTHGSNTTSIDMTDVRFVSEDTFVVIFKGRIEWYTIEPTNRDGIGKERSIITNGGGTIGTVQPKFIRSCLAGSHEAICFPSPAEALVLRQTHKSPPKNDEQGSSVSQLGPEVDESNSGSTGLEMVVVHAHRNPDQKPKNTRRVWSCRDKNTLPTTTKFLNEDSTTAMITTNVNETTATNMNVIVETDASATGSSAMLTAILPLELNLIILGYSDGCIRQTSLVQLARGGFSTKTLTFDKVSDGGIQNSYVQSLHLVRNDRTKERFVVGGGDDGGIAVWALGTLQLRARWTIFLRPLQRVIQLHNEKVGPLRGCALCISGDGTIAVIVIDGFDLLYLIPGAASPLKSICLGGENLLLIYADDSARLWDAKTREFWRSMGADKAGEMTGQGGWMTISMEGRDQQTSTSISSLSNGARSTDSLCTLTLDLERFLKYTAVVVKSINPTESPATTLTQLRAVLSILLTPGLNDDIDNTCHEQLGLEFSSATVGYTRASSTVLFNLETPRDAWCISGEISGARALALTAILKTLSLHEEVHDDCQTVITFYATSLADVVGSSYMPPDLVYLAQRWFDSSNEIRQAARILFDAGVVRLPDEESIALVDAWQHYLPCLQPTVDKDSTQAALALFLCGYMTGEKYSLMSTTALIDISKSIALYLHDDHSAHRGLAIDLCSRGFQIWQHYVDAMEMLRALCVLATSARKENISTQNVGPQARLAVLQIASSNTPLFMTTLTLDILNPKNLEHRKSVMQLVAFLIRKKPLILYPNLPRLMEAVVKSLDPNSSANRDAVLDTATEILGHVVKTFPTIDFHMATQRLAVGTSEGVFIMYDLKTATQMYVLEGHKKRPAACTFSPDGRRLVTVSLEEGVVLVWKVGSSFSSFFKPGAPPRQGHSGSQPFKTLAFNVGAEANMTIVETLEYVRFEWPAERSVRLHIRESVLTFST